VFTGFAGMLADAGFSEALVQKQDLAEIHVNAVFWLTIASGVILTALTFLAAPWLAAFYHAPELKPIYRVVALNFTIAGFGNVPLSLLQKRMQFKAIAHAGTWSLLLSGIVGVILAFLGAGVWSLVAQSLAASLLTSLFRCWCCKWLPRWTFHISALRPLWNYAGNLYAFNFLNYWARNADNLVIGKFFGATALGAYNRSYSLMLLPITQINGVIAQVIFPALSSIKDDKERVKSIYLRAIGVVALVAFPLMTGLLVVAKPFVLTIYGAKWAAVTPLLQILAVVGLMQAIVNSTGWLYGSQGRTDVLLFWGTIFAILYVASFGLGVMLGSVQALAICYTVANALCFQPNLLVSGRLINMRSEQMWSALAGPLIHSAIMASAVLTVALMLPKAWPPWQTLAVLVSTGVATYTGTVIYFQLSAMKEFLRFIGMGEVLRTELQ